MTAEAVRSLATAKAALDAHEYDRALELLAEATPLFRGEPKAELRALLDEAWSRMSIGDVETSIVPRCCSRA